MNKYQIYEKLIASSNEKQLELISYQLTNKMPHLKNLIKEVKMEVYFRKKFNYQVFRGSCNDIIKKLKGIKASFDPKYPLA
jgi:hypothetical protein